MGIKMVFNGNTNPGCSGKGPEPTMAFLKMKENFWNDYMAETGANIHLSEVALDLGYDENALASLVKDGDAYWSYPDGDHIDFGITFDESGDFLLNFNCRIAEKKETENEAPPAQNSKKPCYFWQVYKYHVSADQLTLKGFVDWCNELYQIQYKKPRPKNNRIFVNPDMKVVTVNARFWNKDKIEKWLDDHGYKWTQTIEKRYQYHFDNPDDVELIDSDAVLKARQSA